MDEYLQLLKDAQRWRALMKLQRVRVLGSAGLGTKRQHIGLELWTHYIPNPHQHLVVEAKETLTKFIDTFIVEGQ